MMIINIQNVSFIVLLHLLATVYFPLYYLIIHPNSGVWTIFILLATMIAISWGTLLVPILLVVMFGLIIKFPFVYVSYLVCFVIPLFFLLQSKPKKTQYFLKIGFIFFVLGILIYVATFIAYLNGMTLNNFK